MVVGRFQVCLLPVVQMPTIYYFARGRCLKYCDQRVCLYVCMSVCLSVCSFAR